MVGKLRVTGSAFNNIISGVAVFLSCFVLSFVASSLIVQPQGTKAVTGLTLVSTPTMTLTTDNPTKTLNPNPTQNNGLASGMSTLAASTNVPTGYNLSLSATPITTPANPASTTLSPSTGTITNPTALTSNMWGYALTSTGVTGAFGTTNGFDTSYTAPTPTTTSKWANPTTPTTIKNTTAAATNDQTNVYYGTKADISLPSGTYTSTVTYTATANITDIPTPTITSITPSTGTTAGGTQVQIVGTGFTVNDQSVTTAVTIGGTACTNATISSNTPTTGQDTIYCTTSAHAAAGAVSVVVTTWKSTATKTSAYTYIAPTATITTPTAGQILNAGTTSTTLTVTTDIPATCYYGTATNPTTAMSATGNRTTHTQSITGLTNTSTNTRYVRCNAGTSHTYGANKSVTFYVKATTPAAPTAYKPANNATLGASLNRVNNISATVASGVTCTYTTNKGTLTGSDITGLTAGTTTITYSCTQSSGNTTSNARTGSWSFTIDTSAISTGTIMQTVSLTRPTQCPAVRTRVQDARDTATYWVGRMDDYTRGLENTDTTYDAANPPTTGKCWMLTNLAYGGGGTNTYGDTKAITNSNTLDYTQPYYMIPTGSNRTTGTTDPSTSTNGTGQYGYLYNWCAAMGIQAFTSACADATTPLPDTSISICPSGWRLPTSNTNGEFQQLTDAIGATTNGSNGGSTGSTNLRTTWLAMYSGFWNGSFYNQGSYGYYWSSTQHPSASYGAYDLAFSSSLVYPSSYSSKRYGFAVRCIAV